MSAGAGRALRAGGSAAGSPAPVAQTRPGADAAVVAVADALSELFRLAGSRRVHEQRRRRSGVALSRPGWELLRRADDLGPITVTELANQAAMSMGAASRTVSELEADGLVLRRTDRDDGRVVQVEATPKGRRARARFQAEMHAELRAALGHWDTVDASMLSALLGRLVTDMKHAATIGVAAPTGGLQ